MQIEKQVCSVEQGVRLRELGVEQTGLYWWDTADKQVYRCIDRSAADIGCIVAWTVGELGVMIGNGTLMAELLYTKLQEMMNKGHSIGVLYNVSFLAAFVIELIETGKETVENINNRLQAANG